MLAPEIQALSNSLGVEDEAILVEYRIKQSVARAVGIRVAEKRLISVNFIAYS